MNNDIIVKALIKIMKEQKKQKEDLDYITDFLSLLNEKIDKILEK